MERIPKPDVEQTQTAMIMGGLENMRKQKQYTDVILSCGDVQFPAHKVVLCAGSAYFRSMFESGMRECSSGTVDLQNVSAESLAIVLRYLYTAKISDVEEVELLKDLLATSHMLQLESLYSYYCQLLLDDLTPFDFLEVWDLASLYDDSTVQEYVLSVLAKRFPHARLAEDFLYLTKDRLEDLLCHPELRCDVDDRLEGVLEWVNHDVSCRKNDLEELMALIPLSSASAQCLERLKNEEIVQHFRDLFSKLTAISSRSLEDDVPVVKPHFSTAQEDTKIAVCYNREGSHYLNIYHTSKRCWGDEQKIPFPLHPCATVAATPDGDIMFIGGASCAGDGIQPLDIVLKYSMNTKCLKYAARMSTARCRPGVGMFRGHVYVVGGKYPLLPISGSSTVEKYNCVTDRWIQVPDTINSYGAPEIAQIADCLYVIGLDNSSADVTVEKYDLSSRQWSLVRNFSDRHWESVSVAVWHERILFSVEDGEVFHVLDLENGSFEERTCEGGPTNILKMYSRNPAQRNSCVFVSDGDQLYAFDPTKATGAWSVLTNTFPPSGSLVGSITLV